MRLTGARCFIYILLLTLLSPFAKAAGYSIAGKLTFYIKDGKLILNKVIGEDATYAPSQVNSIADHLNEGPWQLMSGDINNAVWLMMHQNPQSVPADTIVGAQLILQSPISDTTSPSANFDGFFQAMHSTHGTSSSNSAFAGVNPGTMLVPEVLGNLTTIADNLNTQNADSLSAAMNTPHPFPSEMTIDGPHQTFNSIHAAHLSSNGASVEMLFSNNPSTVESTQQVLVQPLTAGRFMATWLPEQKYYTQIFYGLKNCCEKMTGRANPPEKEFPPGDGFEWPEGQESDNQHKKQLSMSIYDSARSNKWLAAMMLTLYATNQFYQYHISDPFCGRSSH